MIGIRTRVVHLGAVRFNCFVASVYPGLDLELYRVFVIFNSAGHTNICYDVCISSGSKAMSYDFLSSQNIKL